MSLGKQAEAIIPCSCLQPSPPGEKHRYRSDVDQTLCQTSNLGGHHSLIALRGSDSRSWCGPILFIDHSIPLIRFSWKSPLPVSMRHVRRYTGLMPAAIKQTRMYLHRVWRAGWRSAPPPVDLTAGGSSREWLQPDQPFKIRSRVKGTPKHAIRNVLMNYSFII